MPAGRFSAEAAAWDNNPFIHIQSENAWQTIQKQFPAYFGDDAAARKNKRPRVLEIGAGTGTLTLRMAPKAEHVVAVDAAGGMIDVLKFKLEKPDAPGNVTAIHALLEDPEDRVLPPEAAGDCDGPRLKFDLITSHLVLHHIPDIPAVLKTMFGCLEPGGWVALTDFEDFGPEARKFHPESKLADVVRDGIRREWIAGHLRDAGFVDVDVPVAWTTKKTVEKFPGEFGDNADAKDASQGEQMDFPFLLCLGRKP